MLHRLLAVAPLTLLSLFSILMATCPVWCPPAGALLAHWALTTGGIGAAAMSVKDVIFFIYGFVGALVGECIKTGHLALPRFYVTHDVSGEQHRVFDPGCFAIAFIGGLAAMYFDHRPITAIAFGLASSYVGRPFYDKFLARVISGGGFSFSLTAPADTPQPEADTALVGQKGGECAAVSPVRAA